MDTSRVTTGDMIAGVGGVVLLISLFLPWYSVSVDVAGFSASESANGWEALGFIDILLFLVAVVAIGVPVAKAAGSLPDDVPGPLLVLAAGGLAVLLVLFRLVDLPTPDLGGGVDFSRKFGIFLGLIAAVGVAYGGWRANEAAPTGSTPAPSPPPPAAPPAAS